MEKARISPIDLEEVMVYLVDKQDEYEKSKEFDIHQEFYDRFKVTSEQLEELLSLIIPIIEVSVSPISTQRYVEMKDRRSNMLLLKTKIK